MLQRAASVTSKMGSARVSNPISGEVGAAARDTRPSSCRKSAVSNPISGEVGAAASFELQITGPVETFQTPSAGRWVLQPAGLVVEGGGVRVGFKPHQRGGGCCSLGDSWERYQGPDEVSNPISGEVGAAAVHYKWLINYRVGMFQTPSAGRWVLQRTCRSSSSAEAASFKPHQRGGGCCSSTPSFPSSSTTSFKPHQRGGGCCSAPRSSSPAGRPATSFKPHQRGGGCCSKMSKLKKLNELLMFQTPSAGRWVLQLLECWPQGHSRPRGFKPHQRGGGCCSAGFSELWSINPTCFKPHQRGGGCCSSRC